MDQLPRENFLLCGDWGTSFLRLRLVDSRDYTIIDEVKSPEGVLSTFKAWQNQDELNRFDFYAERLKDKLRILTASVGLELGQIPIILSGMASSSIGMQELDYVPLPFSVSGNNASVTLFSNSDVLTNPLLLISGVRNDQDVMRGEEVQLIGLLHLKEFEFPDINEGVFIFPGTHSKHIYVKQGNIVDFKTYMTGEIFYLLTEFSILKDSVTSTELNLSIECNRTAFCQGVEVSRKNDPLHTFFSVRTNSLFGKLTNSQNFFYLSGLLIGTEINALAGKTSGRLLLCSGSNLFESYQLAFEVLGLKTNTTFISPDLIDKGTIAGQVEVFKNSKAISNE